MSDRLKPEPVSRRDFLGTAGLLASGVALLGSAVAAMRLPRPRALPEQGRAFRIGRPEEFPSGTSEIVPGRNVLVLSGPKGIAAISLVCTHLGCIVSPASGGFSCPCHGSRFDQLGGVTQGPAPRALPWLAVRKAPNGMLVVDGSQEVPPGTFHVA